MSFIIATKYKLNNNREKMILIVSILILPGQTLAGFQSMDRSKIYESCDEINDIYFKDSDLFYTISKIKKFQNFEEV